jgi:hypothetical protein
MHLRASLRSLGNRFGRIATNANSRLEDSATCWNALYLRYSLASPGLRLASPEHLRCLRWSSRPAKSTT